MTLNELIRALESAKPVRDIPLGFANPHSYRGDFHSLAFEPVEHTSSADMLAAAQSALGKTYEGWKGGFFTMDEHADCYLAKRGLTGEELGPTLLRYMLGEIQRP